MRQLYILHDLCSLTHFCFCFWTR